jgi:hypothetical protein
MVPPGPGVFLVRVRNVDEQHRYTQVRPDPAELARAGLDRFLLGGVNAYRLIEPSADAKAFTCDITVDPGLKRTGTVLDPESKPLTGALVRELAAAWPNGPALKTAQFTVAGLAPREVRQLLFVHVKRKLVGQCVVRGDEKGVVTVRLEPWATLTGWILDEDGRPATGARINLGFIHSTFFVPVTWWVSPQGEVVKTDRHGRFRAEALVAGMKMHMSVSSDRMVFLPLAGTPDGQKELTVRPGETRDLGDLKVKGQ